MNREMWVRLGALPFTIALGAIPASTGCSVLADVFPPDVLERASAVAVNAVGGGRADDHVFERRSVGQFEQWFLTFTLTAVTEPIVFTAPRARSCRSVRSRRKWPAMLTFIRITLADPKILKFY